MTSQAFIWVTSLAATLTNISRLPLLVKTGRTSEAPFSEMGSHYGDASGKRWFPLEERLFCRECSGCISQWSLFPTHFPGPSPLVPGNLLEIKSLILWATIAWNFWPTYQFTLSLQQLFKITTYICLPIYSSVTSALKADLPGALTLGWSLPPVFKGEGGACCLWGVQANY